MKTIPALLPPACGRERCERSVIHFDWQAPGKINPAKKINWRLDLLAVKGTERKC